MTRQLGTRPFAPSIFGRCRAPYLLILTLAVAFTLTSATPHPTFAQEETGAVQTTPSDGEIPRSWPETVTATFPVEIDPDASTLRLVDIHGQDVEDTTLEIADNGVTMSLRLPADMTDGVYSMIWDATPQDSGEPITGYSSFSVGNPEDAAIITVPSTTGTGDEPPQWLQTGARWSALTGMIAAIAVWPTWTLIVRPSLRPMWRRGPKIMAAMQQYAFIAFSLAFLGSLLELAVYSRMLQDGTWLDKLMNTVGNTDWGMWWLGRMLLLTALGVVLALSAWWFPGRNPYRLAAAWGLSMLAPLPVSITSHAADDSVGRATAVATDYVHLLAAGLWGGSVIILATVLLPALRRMDAAAIREVLAIVAVRFGGLTLISWGALALTGAYSAWLFVGDRTALTETDYGQALMVKMGLTVLTLILVAIGLVMIRRRTSSASPANGSHLRWVLLAQGVLILAILVTVGRMNTTPTARDVIVEQSNQITIPVEFGDQTSLYLIAPARAGVNHLRLEIPGTDLPGTAEAFVTISSPDYPEIGTKELQMYRVTGNAFEHHGTEFAFAGDWDMTVRLLEPNALERTFTFSQHIAEETTTLDVPENPWRFETTGGTAGLILILVGLAGGVISIFVGGSTRKEAGGLGAAALALAVVLLMQARFDSVLAVSDEQGAINPDDLAMVARGEDVYNTYCMQCHGPELRGDGPAGNGMVPPPADFSAPHTFVHSNEDLIYWIQNGKQGTAMPGFAGQLTDQEMRDVIAFIQNWQQNYDGTHSEAPPAP